MEIDTPTRVGTGGVAVGVFTGVLVVVMAPLPMFIWLPLLSISGLAALWGFVPVIRAVLPFSGDNISQFKERDLRATTAGAEQQRDVGLYDAIWRIRLGKWPQATAKPTDEAERGALWECWRLIRQEAFDGKVPIWGKLGPVAGLFELIPKEFWKEGNVCMEANEPLWALPGPGAYWAGAKGRGNWSDLKTSRSKIEELWPAHSVIVHRGGDIHIGPGTYKAGDGGPAGKGGDISLRAGDASSSRTHRSQNPFDELQRRVAEVESAKKEAARLDLAKLRADGVALRNKADDAYYSAFEWEQWRNDAVAWNDRTIAVIKTVNEADAVHFSILDVVPPARVLPEVPWDDDAAEQLFNMHDFRLVKLEQLVHKYSQS